MLLCATTGAKRGRPRTYSALSFLLLAVAAVALRTFKERELHRLLLEDAALRTALGFAQSPAPAHHRAADAGVDPGGRGASRRPRAQIAQEVGPLTSSHRRAPSTGGCTPREGPRWHQEAPPRRRHPVGACATWTRSRRGQRAATAAGCRAIAASCRGWSSPSPSRCSPRGAQQRRRSDHHGAGTRGAAARHLGVARR